MIVGCSRTSTHGSWLYTAPRRARRVRPSSIRSALAFLTIVPVAGRDAAPGERLGRAVFPAVGILLGLAAWVARWLGSLLAGSLVGAVAALATLALLTGGLHLDGFADCADGLLAMGGRERRLEIMRDQRLGTFGAVARLPSVAVLAAPPLVLDWRHRLLGAAGAATAAAGVAWLAYRRIGGATGDVYGAVSETAQLAVLLAFVVPL